MEWLEITISTAAADIKTVTTALTAAGFSDLVIEDQEERIAIMTEGKPEIVMCKDCKYWHHSGYCKKIMMVADRFGNDFCSYGERREGE